MKCVIPGGGVSLIQIVNALNKLMTNIPEDEKVGFNIVKRALEEPIRQIARDAGLDGAVIAEKAKTKRRE
jgi:chaperonin GroEL